MKKEDKAQSNFLIESMVFSLIINWYTRYASKELSYLYSFFYGLSVILIILILLYTHIYPYIWSFHITSLYDYASSFNWTYKFELIKHFFVVLPNYNFAECQITVVSLYNIPCDFFCLR